LRAAKQLGGNPTDGEIFHLDSSKGFDEMRVPRLVRGDKQQVDPVAQQYVLDVLDMPQHRVPLELARVFFMRWPENSPDIRR
jgi:hypothetical protein